MEPKPVSRFVALFAWLLLVASRTAVAQTNAVTNAVSSRLSLVEAQRASFQRNWDLLAAQSDVDLAVAQKIVAKEFPNPTLALSTQKIDTDRSSATHLGNGFWDRSYDSIFAVNQLFEMGAKRGSRKQSAAAGLEGAGARLQDARRVLNQAVAKSY